MKSKSTKKLPKGVQILDQGGVIGGEADTHVVSLHTNIPLSEAHDQTIGIVYDADHGYRKAKSGTTTPPSDKLFNFDLKVGDRRFLVLDNYGADLIPHEIEERVLEGSGSLMGNGTEGNRGYTLAIDRRTGVVYAIAFAREACLHPVAIMWVFPRAQDLPLRVPLEGLKRIDELKSCKRPFRLLLDPLVLMSFIEREIGYRDLRAGLTLRLDFRPMALEITHDSYRYVGAWK